MRLWSIHPCYLDSKGLVALWRESLLARNVLLGKTRGYQHHPQLNRFRTADDPAGAISDYLWCIADEADRRGYHFDRGKIFSTGINGNRLSVTFGQVTYEFNHLLKKLEIRNYPLYQKISAQKEILTHPVFYKIPGNIEDWEIIR